MYKSSYLLVLVLSFIPTFTLSARESCYEQYFREHNKKILTAEDADDRTYVADVHVALVDSTWYMWLSVDPLVDKYLWISPYAYCAWNPVKKEFAI